MFFNSVLDNPSYFSVPTDEPDCAPAQIRRKCKMGTSESSSETSLTRQLTPPRCSNNRKGFRNFLRSVSTNSADSNQELLIMGEPRLSDMAPDLAFKHPSRSNSLKRSQENGQYCPLPTSEEEPAADLLEEDEVFLADDCARYSNFSAIKRISNGNNSPTGTGSPRRHSISTFNSRDRTNSVASSSRSFKDDFSTTMQESVATTSAIDEHSLRHMSYPRKRCLKCSKGTILKQANMDDILIFSRKSGESVKLWVEYFISYFQQISKQTNVKPYKIKTVYLEDALKPCVEDKEFIEGATGVKLQLVIVCPDFLEFIAEHPKESANLLKILLPDRTLALLLGVTDADLTDVHKNAIPSYFQWQRQSVGRDQDQTFTKEFLNQGRTILYKIWKQQSLVIAQEKTSFSVTPKKIRQGQNSIFIILNYPLQKEDIVKIQIERNGELEEIKTMKRRNPYMIKISVPENLTEVTAIVNILVEKNGSIVGSRPIKVESKLKELEQILKSSNNPVEFMCQTLGFSPADREHLDNSLVQGFQKNLPPHLNLLGSHSTPFEASKSVHKHSNEEFPTLLHFAARFGLEKLAMQLMDCPGADVAYEVRNVFDMTPPEIADANGFHSLSSSLKGYMCMNDLATAYTKMEELSLKHSDYLDENGYLQATVVQNLYKTLPPPRPVNPQTTNAIVHTPTSDCGSSWYLANDRAPINYSREDLHKNPEDSEAHLKSEQHRRNLKSPPPNAQKSNTPAIIEDKYLNELAEIINDFKNKVHSLDQVEKLVEEWKSRNDVQKSWKEKQDQLNEMRLRVDKLHRETKKPGAVLSIIKKVFSRHRKPVSISEEKEDEITSLKNVISMPPFQLNQSCRPISSLSTSSSGSSARMSTISGCSIGDSGTHSDNEERKMTFASQPDHLFNKVLLEMNYNMVPAPRPVRDPNRNPWETIEENRPNTRPDTQQVYIQFPPNGQPVEGLAGMDQSQQEYMNIPSSQNYQHEYINYKPAS